MPLRGHLDNETIQFDSKLIAMNILCCELESGSFGASNNIIYGIFNICSNANLIFEKRI